VAQERKVEKQEKKSLAESGPKGDKKSKLRLFEFHTNTNDDENYVKEMSKGKKRKTS